MTAAAEAVPPTSTRGNDPTAEVNTAWRADKRPRRGPAGLVGAFGACRAASSRRRAACGVSAKHAVLCCVLCPPRRLRVSSLLARSPFASWYCEHGRLQHAADGTPRSKRNAAATRYEYFF